MDMGRVQLGLSPNILTLDWVELVSISTVCLENRIMSLSRFGNCAPGLPAVL